MGLTLTLQAQVMAAMGMTLRVVVPPHPLICLLYTSDAADE